MEFYKYYSKSGFEDKYKLTKMVLPDHVALYFSPCDFGIGQSDAASEYLALPYEPLHRLTFHTENVPPKATWSWEPKENKNPCEHFSGVRRVWAAFGKPGGGWEFMASGEVGNQIPTHLELSDGGCEDPYYKELLPTAHWEREIETMRGTALYFMNSTLISFTEKKRAHVKMPDMSTVVIYYAPDYTRYEFTISMSYKKSKGIKIWGVFWKDYDTNRYLSDIICRLLPDWKFSQDGLKRTALHFCVGATGETDFGHFLLSNLNHMHENLEKMAERESPIWAGNLLECPPGWKNPGNSGVE